MRLTDVHARFWQAHRGPGWAQALTPKALAPASIHACINAHATPPPYKTEWRSIHASNTVSLIRSMRRRQPVVEVLAHLAASGDVIADPRRRVRCTRWLQRALALRVAVEVLED